MHAIKCLPYLADSRYSEHKIGLMGCNWVIIIL